MLRISRRAGERIMLGDNVIIEILGVTESRVCQIHGQITKKLRVELEADEQLFSEVA